jgi:hypothetical protein
VDEHPTRRINRKRTAAQLNCVCPCDAGDVGPTVHHDPPTCGISARNELPRQIQTPGRLHAARAEVHGYGPTSGFEQGGDPADRIDSIELAIGTDDVESGDDH